MKKLRIKDKQGFTLVEMIVSVGIFSVIVLTSVSATLFISDVGRKAREMKRVLDEVNFAMEAMSREIRMGYNYRCGGTDSGDGNCRSGALAKSTLKFKNVNNEEVTFFLSSSGDRKSIKRQVGNSTVDITSSNVDIESLKFLVWGADNNSSTPDGPPRVMISVKGKAVYKGQTFDFNLQTTAAQRKLDQY